MPKEPPLKSSFELAMERLKAEDREHGVAAPQKLTATQKRRIAEAREKARAKLAEIEILHRKDVQAAADDAKALAALDEAFRVDRQRVESSMTTEIERIRRQERGPE